MDKTTMMPDLHTQPVKPNEAIAEEPKEYIFIRNNTVIGEVAADCCVCAWNKGKALYPGAFMAHTWSSAEIARMTGAICIIRENLLRKQYKAGKL